MDHHDPTRPDQTGLDSIRESSWKSQRPQWLIGCGLGSGVRVGTTANNLFESEWGPRWTYATVRTHKYRHDVPHERGALYLMPKLNRRKNKFLPDEKSHGPGMHQGILQNKHGHFPTNVGLGNPAFSNHFRPNVLLLP